MAYGKIKADAIIYDNSGSDVEVSTADITGKANLASPTFTGTPAAPTAGSGTNTTQIATTAFVTTGLANLVDSSPSALNTLNELAAALGDDANFSTTVTNSIATKLPLAGGTLTGGLTGTTGTFTGTVVVDTSAASNTDYGGQFVNSKNSSPWQAAINSQNKTSGGPVWAGLAYNFAGNNAQVTSQIFENGSASFSGAVTADSYKTPAQAVSALAIDLATGNYFTKTISGNSTFTFTNPPASGTVGSFTLELTHTSGTVTWPSSVKFPGDSAPSLTAGKTHLFIFVTDDGGTRYRGAALADYVN